MAEPCSRCGTKPPILSAHIFDEASRAYYCSPCYSGVQKENTARVEQLKEKAATVIVTTTPTVDGHRVTKYLGIESVEFVIGTGLFSELTSDFQDFFGQRSSAFEKKMQQAKATALQTIRMRAAARGANAVLAIDLDYTEFSGNRIGLILNGTLVELVPLP